MKTLIAVLVACVAVPLFAQSEVATQINAATKLVDDGKVDEGIAALSAIVKEHPDSDDAAYELGLAYSVKGDQKKCVELMTPLAGKKGPLQPSALGMLGNCLDESGQPDKAIDAYRRGLKIAPDDSQLLFNLAVSLLKKKQFDDARALLKHDTQANPSHASGHLALARVFDAQQFVVPAVFSYLHFLALEPASPRSHDAAARLIDLLKTGVERKDAKNINITIDPDAPKDEGDYTSFALFMAAAEANRDGDESAKLDDFGKTQEQIKSVISMLIELDGKEHDYTATVQRPFFIAMQKAKMLDMFAAIAIVSLHLDGANAWGEKNADGIRQYSLWIAPQTKPRGVEIKH